MCKTRKKIGLTDDEKETVLSIIKRHIPADTEVFFFGSRVDNTANPASDLDVLLKNEDPIALSTMSQIKEELEQSDLPFKVDLIDYHQFTKKMLKNISRSLVRVV